MKNTMRVIRDEKGKVLILALLVLVVGGLVLTPLLGLASTGLVAGGVYEIKTAELYAADAGVEDGMWKIMNSEAAGLPAIPCGDQPWEDPFEYDISDINGKNVHVSIEYLGEGVFRITSTASGDDSDTTVLSYVHGVYEEAGIEYDYPAYDGEIMDEVGGDTVVYGEGDLTVTGNIQDSATVYVEGNLDVGGNIEGDSVQVYVKGDLVMSGFGNIEDTAIVCVAGDLYIGHCSEDGVEVYVEGNLIGVGSGNGIENEAKVCVEGDVTVNKIEGGPTVCVGGTLTADVEDGYIYADGYDNPFDDCVLCSPDCPDCRICCECPLSFESAGAGSWSDWNLATYSINS